MKYFFVLLFFVSSQVFANEMICSLWYLSSAKKYAEAQSNPRDKFKHCTLSCYLSLRCPSTEVWNLGLAKEFVDVFGPGNAEMADLEADMKGIIYSYEVDTDKGCVNACNEAYPKK